MINLPIVIALSTLLLVWCRSVWRRTNPSGLPLPPGPRGLPLLGNVLDIDLARPWLTYNVWAEKYALSKWPEHCSNNVPRSIRIFGANFITGFLGYTDEWRLHQKLFHSTLHPKATEKYEDMYLEGARELVVSLLDGFMGATGELEGHLTMFSAALIMAITYGYKATSRDDPIVNRVQRLADIYVTEMPSERAMLFTVFPSLLLLPSWFPGMAFKGKIAATRNLAAEVKDVPFKFVKEQMAAGTYTRSMVSDLLQSYEDTIDGELERAIKDTAATVYLGGADTTSATLLTFILAMILHPEVQERARAEIDAVVGRDALPGFEHRSSLPYIEAILRETMRWYPIAPLGMPHATSTSYSYGDYYIPKGAVVMLNVCCTSGGCLGLPSTPMQLILIPTATCYQMDSFHPMLTALLSLGSGAEHDESPSRLRIWQQNLNTSDKAQESLINGPLAKDWDVLALQEPAMNRMRNTKANPKWRTVYPTHRYTHDQPSRA
ncbi:cytochrome P450, partial [Leucogyrophana mollusca]